jgi:hypothetical protein
MLMCQQVRKLPKSVHAPELGHFSRSLFLLSRQCGASGLRDESRELFRLALATRPLHASRPWDFWAYRLAVVVMGWRIAGRVACSMDRWRPRSLSAGPTDLTTQAVA